MTELEKLQKDYADAKAAYIATNDYYGPANDAAWDVWFKSGQALKAYLKESTDV